MHQTSIFRTSAPARRTIQRLGLFALPLLVSPLSFNLAARAQTIAAAPRPLITQVVDEATLATLRGNTRPEATAAHDRGLASDDLAMDHMLLQLQRSPEQELALTRFIDALHDPASPSYHQWLTAEQFGSRLDRKTSCRERV